MPRLDSDLVPLLLAAAEGDLPVEGRADDPLHHLGLQGGRQDRRGRVGPHAAGIPPLRRSRMRGADAPPRLRPGAAAAGGRRGRPLGRGDQPLAVAPGAGLEHQGAGSFRLGEAADLGALGDAGAYAALDRIDWPEGFCRRDIGWRAVARET
jgi:phosphoribosylamine--glycine ligase